VKMKLFGKIVLMLALLSGVVYAKKVKLFDISKYDLKKKDKTGLETFKVGDIIVKTDLKYYENSEMYYEGSNIHVYMNDFEGVSILIKRNIIQDGIAWESHYPYGKITLSDEFGAEVNIGYRGSYI